MWRVPRPSTAAVKDQLDLALRVRVSGQSSLGTLAEKTAVLDLYQQYEANAGRPTNALLGAGMRGAFLDAMRDAYKHVQDNGRLASLRAELKSTADQCPYCGFGEVADLDHHLQRAHYRPVSIFPLNLIPACAQCNRIKPKNQIVDPAKHGLNSYLEDVTTYKFLVANVSIEPITRAVVVEFQVRQSFGMSDEMFNRLTNHLVVFDLQERYGTQINIYLSGLETSFLDNYNSGGGAAVARFLRKSSKASEKQFGWNDWRAALLRGLCKCRDFCDGGFMRP